MTQSWISLFINSDILSWKDNSISWTIIIIINSDKIFINRDNAKNGNVAIIKVIIDNEVSDKKIVMSDDWHVFLKKIKSMKGISVSEMGVFASSGAEMVGTSFIDSIETDPPVSFRIFDDSIKFQNACRIIMIKKKDDIDINGFVFKPLNQIVESINQSSKQSNNVNILLPSEKVNFIRKQNIIRPKMNSIYSDVTNIFNLNRGVAAKAPNRNEICLGHLN